MQENVLAESSMMVPETRQRLEAALSDLQSYVVSAAQPLQLSGTLVAGVPNSSAAEPLFQQPAVTLCTEGTTKCP
jgi:tubulin-specific chaperone A